MIIIKTEKELQKMRMAGRIAGNALALAGQAVKPGISTLALDSLIRTYIESQGAKPSFLGYGGFPASSCISVNDVVIHGVPSKDCILKRGDIVSIDVGAFYEGFHGDTAWTFPCGEIEREAQDLVDATRESLFAAIKAAVPGNRIGDVSSAVQEYVEARGYGVVRDFVGHGVGADLHEDPAVPNFGTKGRGIRLEAGMVIAIEPMINAGDFEIEILPDGAAVTSDGSLSAHFEHSIAIRESGAEILTTPEWLLE
jgi:methionyl aminopeptidase